MEKDQTSASLLYTCLCAWWLILCNGKRAFSEPNSLNLRYIITFIGELFMLNIHVTFLHINIKADFIKLDIQLVNYIKKHC